MLFFYFLLVICGRQIDTKSIIYNLKNKTKWLMLQTLYLILYVICVPITDVANFLLHFKMIYTFKLLYSIKYKLFKKHLKNIGCL